MNRADHHADSVNEIALAIAGAVVSKKNAEKDSFQSPQPI